MVLHVRQTLLREDGNSCNIYRKEKRKVAVKGASSCTLEIEAKCWGYKEVLFLFSSQAGLCLVGINARQSQMQK